MHYLPVVTWAARALELPLCDASAATLAACWLDRSDARQQACALLRSEPVLAIWCYCQQPARSMPADELHTDWPLLADWLLRSGQAIWRRADAAAEPPSSSVTETSRRRFAALSLQQWESHSVAPTARLSSLLSAGAQQWLELLTLPASVEPAADAARAAIHDASSSEPGEGGGELLQRWLASSLERQVWLADLARRLDRAAQLEQRLDELVRDEKLQALKEFAYGASHELNNPLANISTRAQALLRDETDPERRRKLATINTQAFRAHEMIADLMLFARPPRLEYQQFALDELVANVLGELGELATAQQTRLHHASPTGLAIQGDPRHLAVALRALVQNSLEALGTGGEVHVQLEPAMRNVTAGLCSGVELRVTDDGPGIPAAIRSRIFDPYYSGREAGRGLGLGLSKAWRIVTQHGGQLSLADQVESGAMFVVWLPSKPGIEQAG